MIFTARGFQGMENLVNMFATNTENKAENRAAVLLEGRGNDPEAFLKLLCQVAEENLPCEKKNFDLISMVFEEQGGQVQDQEKAAAAESYLLSSLITTSEKEVSHDRQKRGADFVSILEMLSTLSGDNGLKERENPLKHATSCSESEKTPSHSALFSVAEYAVAKAMQNVAKETSGGDDGKIDSNTVKLLDSPIMGPKSESVKLEEKPESAIQNITVGDGNSIKKQQESNMAFKGYFNGGSDVARENGLARFADQTTFPLSFSDKRHAVNSLSPEQGQTGAEIKSGGAEIQAGNRSTLDLPGEERNSETFAYRKNFAANLEFSETIEKNNGEKVFKDVNIQNIENHIPFAKNNGSPLATSVSQAPLNQELHENAGALKSQTTHFPLSLENDSSKTDEKLTNQILVRLFTGLQQGSRKMVIDLNPPELGRLKVNIIYSDKGGLKVHMHPQSEQVIGLLERHLPTLQQSLESQGVSLLSLQVGVESGNQQTSHFQGQGFGASGGNPDRLVAAEENENAVSSEEGAEKVPERTGAISGLSLRV